MSRPWALWYRPEEKRARWSVVADAETFGEAVRLVGVGDRHNGEWMVLPAGRHPNQCGCPDWKVAKAPTQSSHLGGDS